MDRSTSSTLVASGSILATACCAGASAGVSVFSTPAILDVKIPPQIMARQWYTMYHRGKVIPILSVASSVTYGVASYMHMARGLEWRGFALSAAFTASFVPFTLWFLMPVNLPLADVAFCKEKEKALSKGETEGLIRKWIVLNNVRFLLPLAGAFVGMWNLVC